MSPNGFTYRIDLIEGPLHRNWASHIPPHPDGKENRIEATRSHSWDIDIPVLVPGANVKSLIENQSLCRVDMRVHNDRALVEVSCARGNLLLRTSDKTGSRNKNDNGSRQVFHAHL